MRSKRVLIIASMIIVIFAVSIALVSCANTGKDGNDLTILESSENFEITDEQARKLYEHQRAEDLRITLLNSPEIEDAIVVIDLGEITLEGDLSSGRNASASVILIAKENNALSDRVIQDVADIIRGGVSGISYEDITITDSNLNVYAIGDGYARVVRERNYEIIEGMPDTDNDGTGTTEYPYDNLVDDESYVRIVWERNYEIVEAGN